MARINKEEILDILLEEKARPNTVLKTATVAEVSPLKIILDGDTVPLPYSPPKFSSAMQLQVNDRVIVALLGKVTVLGRIGDDYEIERVTNWEDLEGVPEEFPPEEHYHDGRYYTKTESGNLFAPKDHNHTGSDITSAVDKADKADKLKRIDDDNYYDVGIIPSSTSGVSSHYIGYSSGTTWYKLKAGNGYSSSGSNSNGRYIRFDDGTQICYHNVGELTSPESVGNIYRSAESTRWDYPAMFLEKPALSVSVSSNVRWGAITGGDNTHALIRQFSALPYTTGMRTLVMAVGRWK